MSEGQQKAWETLESLDPLKVKRDALVEYDPGPGAYAIQSLNMEVRIKPGAREITASESEADALIKRLGYFFNHAVLWYLVKARDIGLSGRLIKPEGLKGGHHFFTGTHELPLKGVAAKYGSGKELFLERASALGGRPREYGDASVELYPLPRIPLTLILWLADEEFPARADLLFDSSSEIQLPIDLNWSVAMFTLLAML